MHLDVVLDLENYRERSHDPPEQGEEHHHDDREKFNAFVFRLLEDLDKAVQERCKPEKPLQECRQHDGSENGYIDNLSVSVSFVLQVTGDCNSTHISPWPWCRDGRDSIVCTHY